jgi:hypothetical protein
MQDIGAPGQQIERQMFYSHRIGAEEMIGSIYMSAGVRAHLNTGNVADIPLFHFRHPFQVDARIAGPYG